MFSAVYPRLATVSVPIVTGFFEEFGGPVSLYLCGARVLADCTIVGTVPEITGLFLSAKIHGDQIHDTVDRQCRLAASPRCIATKKSVP